MTEHHITWLTPEAFQRLSDELAYLKGEGRAKISAKIAQAREEGDLSENGGYHAAREEQGHQEARIRQLSSILEHAKVGELASDSDKVAPGMQVTISYDDDPEDQDTFVLGSRELLGLDESMEVEVFSPQSPLGSAILGLGIGDVASYVAPNGSRIEVTIVEVSPFSS